MSILITGGTGFIGAEVARQLVAQGESEIHILHQSGNFRRLQDIANQLHFVQANLGDYERILEIVQTIRPQIIYHMGAMLTGPGEANPQAAIQTNAMGTYYVLEAARLFDVPQVLFASSVGVYGADIQTEFITDFTLQRPTTIYGITKVFGEQLGTFYKRKYGLDFRGLRYPSIVGPGVSTPSVVQYTSWIIEECAKGNPFVVTVTPDRVVSILYYKDAARAAIELGRAPLENIATVNYLINGVKPTPSAGQLADIVKQRIPDAQISFQPKPELQTFLRRLRPLDDSCARTEWNWQPAYDLEAMVDDFLSELKRNHDRYM